MNIKVFINKPMIMNKNRFEELMKSTLGNVIPLISEQGEPTTPTTPTPTTTVPKATVVVKLPTMKKGQSLVITSIAKTIKLSLPVGAKIVVTRLTVSKAICTVYTNKVATKTTVKGLKAGSCKVTIKVTPKATTKVKNPRTSTSNVTIKVT